MFEKIKTLCSKNGISVTQLEKELSLGKGTICNWKSGNPGIDKLQKVAEFFEVNIQYLIDSENMLSNDALDFAVEYDRLSEKQKELVKVYISII